MMKQMQLQCFNLAQGFILRFLQKYSKKIIQAICSFRAERYSPVAPSPNFVRKFSFDSRGK